jgi:hypothetical protein
MKKQFSFMIGFFILGLILGISLISYSYSSEEQFLLEKTSNDLVEIAEIKADKINLYLSGVEENIKTLQESDEIKELLKQELVFDESVIKFDVDERSRIISKEVENYLISHPEMTLNDLKVDEEFYEIAVQPVGRSFQEIAVQPVGKEGYSFAFDSQTLINYFHKEPRRIGYDYNTMEKTFPALWNMFKETSEKGFSEGFYYRDEPNGSISHKYGKFVQIPVATADGINISLGATAYVNDYRIIKEESEYLENFKEDLGYYNLILVSSNGYVIYQVEKKEGLGTNLEWPVNLNKGLSRNYFNAKESNQASFDGPFIRYHGEIYPKFFLMTPVYNKSKLLGFIGLIDGMDEIFKITEDIKNLRETGEVYLVNQRGLLISPLRNKDLDIIIQSVDTENSKNCFDETFPGHFERDESISSFLNYGGEEVFGTHREIYKTDWCLLIEVEKGEVIDVFLRENIKRNLLIIIPAILILTLVGFFIGKYFDKKGKRKIRRFPCKIKGKSQPLYCKLMGGKCETYPHGMCGRVIKIRNFFINLKLRYYFLFALVFAVGYLFIVTSFFQGLQNAKLFDDIPDMLVFVVGFMILAYGLKIKKFKAKKFIILGGLLICLRRMFDIILQEYQLLTGNTLLIWVPVLAMELTGFLLLLIGFGRLKND